MHQFIGLEDAEWINFNVLYWVASPTLENYCFPAMLKSNVKMLSIP